MKNEKAKQGTEISLNPVTRVLQNKERQKNRGDAADFAWDDASPQLVARLVCLSVANGYAVQFGRTTDKKVGSVSFWDYKSPSQTLWLRAGEDVDLWLTSFCESIEFGVDDTAQP